LCLLCGFVLGWNLARLSQALTDFGVRIRTEMVPDGLPFTHDATSLAAAEVWNLVCADGEFGISFHPCGFTGGYAQLAVNAHRLRVGDVEVVVADLADVIRQGVRRPSERPAGAPVAVSASVRAPCAARSRTRMNTPYPRLLPPARGSRSRPELPKASQHEPVRLASCAPGMVQDVGAKVGANMHSH
jgi:hypothetical protein